MTGELAPPEPHDCARADMCQMDPNCEVHPSCIMLDRDEWDEEDDDE